MQDQVVMSPNNGALCVAIPLYRFHHQESIGSLQGYVISLTKDEPLYYAIDFGEDVLKALSAEWIEENLEFLGDL